MRRMYGDQRHISVLRAEIESNDVEYLSEWKFREDARRRYTTTSDPTRAFSERVTSPHFRPASTTGSTTKVTTTFKTQQIKSDYMQKPRPVTPYPDNNSSVTRKTSNSTLNTTMSATPVSMTAQTTTEATVRLSPNSSMLESDKTVKTAADIPEVLETSTTSCTSTEQTESSTMEPPTATVIESTSEESTTATTHTEQVFESQLFQDSEEMQADSNSQSTPTGAVKLRGV
jgi:hypothetical protein